jgi:protocatechuate 3,4-dioxygenase beta subunit
MVSAFTYVANPSPVPFGPGRGTRRRAGRAWRSTGVDALDAGASRAGRSRVAPIGRPGRRLVRAGGHARRRHHGCSGAPEGSDVLGVSMLVDAINHRLPNKATETTVLGPFYVQAAAECALGDDISGGLAGEPLLVEGTVSRIAGTPIAGAIVESWHADSGGFYDVQGHAGLDGLAGRARFRTDEKGRCWFRSIVPAYYPIPPDGPVGDVLKAQGRHPSRPTRVHFMVGHPGCETLVTHIFRWAISISIPTPCSP